MLPSEKGAMVFGQRGEVNAIYDFPEPLRPSRAMVSPLLMLSEAPLKTE